MRARPPAPTTVDRRRRLGAIGLLIGVAALGLPSRGSAAAFDLTELMKQLSKTRAGEATFVERRESSMLDRTLESSGRLSFEAPDTFVRETLRPRRDRMAVTGNTVTMSQGGRSRTMALDASPEAGVIVEAIRGTLTGNRAALERLFETTLSGTAERWTLDLLPRDLRLRGQVASVKIRGEQAVVREIEVLLADGDRSVMRIEPAARATSGPAPDAAKASGRP